MLRVVIAVVALTLSCGIAAAQAKNTNDVKILDGQSTRIFFTGNPHHPTFGKEKLTQLLQRHFAGKSPITVDGLADARKDPFSQKPIPPAKIPELIRFLEPQFKSARPKDERLIVLNYVIVEEPRVKKSPEWVKEGADALEKYARDAFERGVRRMFFAEMVQPDHIMAGLAGNKFRRAGLKVFDALESRKISGIERGPHLQVKMEKQKHFFRDDRHYSQAGKDYIGCLWFESLLKHDGLAIPSWLRDEIRILEAGDAKVEEHLPARFETSSNRFRGNWTIVKWDGKVLQIETAVEARAKKSTLAPSRAAWQAFWKEIDAINVWTWDKEYIDKKIVDGQSWELHFERGSKKVRCEGSNRFPPQLERYEKALERLLADKAGP